jgi:hypothetical protein|tara:strand:+ start:727 stop:963 length:237 start_codon:yes stop_codon:yes gene_type:complete
MKLSNQAAGALMMALQKCLMEETDIMPLLQNMDFFVDIKQDEDGISDALFVKNPPVVSFEDTQTDNVQDFIDGVLQEE